MDSNESAATTFAGSTDALAKALLGAPAMRPWPPTLDEACSILTGQPYEVIERIGHGGMGAVFKVRNLEPGMDRIEAVKIRRPEARDDDLFRARFLREIGTLAQLRHPGITTVFRSGDSAEGYLWFSMEFLDGRSLAELLAPGLPPLTPERVLDITRQLCITLQFIHTAGRLHRDLKPANVMVCDDGSVRLLDFGIARPAETSPMGALTRPGDTPHTPDYASPEQKVGGPVDERTDLYGLGRIVTEMIRPAADAARERQSRFAQRLLDLVADLLAYDRQDRPASAAEVIEKLGQIEPGSPCFWGKDRCPFRGLEAYQPEHAEIFFGRDAAIRRGQEILQQTPQASWNGFLLITGASGSGKSSLARAGLGPALVHGSIPSAAGNLKISPILCDLSTIRPDNDCMLAPLARLLAAAVPHTDPTAIADALRNPAADLGHALCMPPDPARVVAIALVLDQFEHFFRSDLPRSGQTRFLTAIARLARTPGIAVLATLRSDFYHQCADHPALMDLKDGRQIDVASPQPWELTAMLRLSARAGGLAFETGPDGRSLDDVLLEHARRNPQSLPLLSFVLEQLWEHRDLATNTLRFADYEALGGFEGAIAEKACVTFSRFAENYPDEAAAAFDDLFHLVVETENSGAASAFVRRRAAPAEVPDEKTPAGKLAEAFISARLFVHDSSGMSLAHESLLSETVVKRWETLNEWLRGNQKNLTLRHHLECEAKSWNDRNKPPKLLLSANDVTDAAQLCGAKQFMLSEVTRDFIKESISSRNRRRLLVKAAWVMMPVIICIISGSIWKRRESLAKETADKALTQTVLRAAAAEESLRGMEYLSQDDPDSGLAWLAKAYRTDPANEYASWLSGQLMLERQQFFPQTFASCHDLLPKGNPPGLVPFAKGALFLGITGKQKVLCRILVESSGLNVAVWPPAIFNSGLEIAAFAVAPNKSVAALVLKNGTVCMVDSVSNRIRWQVPSPDAIPKKMWVETRVEHGLCFSTSGKSLIVTSTVSGRTAAGTEDAESVVAVLRVESGESIRSFLHWSDSMSCVGMSCDELYLAASTRGGNLLVADMKSGSGFVDASNIWQRGFAGVCHMVIPLPLSNDFLISGQNKGFRVVRFNPASVLRDGASAAPVWDKFILGGNKSFTVTGSIALSSGGEYFAMVGPPAELGVFRTADGEAAGPSLKIRDGRGCVAFLDDARIMVSGGENATVWDWRSGARTAWCPHDSPVSLGNNDFLSLDGRTRTCALWHIKGECPLQCQISTNGGKTAFDLDQKRQTLLACAQGWGVQLVDLKTLRRIGPRLPFVTAEGRSEVARRMIMRPRIAADGSAIITWIKPDNIAVYSISENPQQLLSCNAGIPIICANLSPDGRILVWTAVNGHWEAWDVASRVQLATNDVLRSSPLEDGAFGEAAESLCLEFSDDGRFMAIGTQIWCTVSIWDTKTWRAVQPPLLRSHAVNDIAFSPLDSNVCWAAGWQGDCDRLSCSASKKIGDPVEQIHHNGAISDCSVSADGTKLATASWDMNTNIWDTVTCLPRQRLRHSSAVTSVDWAPDGRRLITSTAAGDVIVWDVEKCRQLIALPQDRPVMQAAFGLDGSRLIVALGNGTLIIKQMFTGGSHPPGWPNRLEWEAGAKVDRQGLLNPVYRLPR